MTDSSTLTKRSLVSEGVTEGAARDVKGPTGDVGGVVFQHTGAVKGFLPPVTKNGLWTLCFPVMECVTHDGAVEVTLVTGNDCGSTPQNLGNSHGVSTPVTAGRPRSGPLNETALDAFSFAVAASVVESNTAVGDKETLPNYTCTDLPCSLGLSTFKTVLQEVVATGLLYHRICATKLSMMFCSVKGRVTESGAVGDRAHDQAVCASIAPPGGLGASTRGLDSGVVSTRGFVLGGVAPNKVVVVERLLI